MIDFAKQIKGAEQVFNQMLFLRRDTSAGLNDISSLEGALDQTLTDCESFYYIKDFGFSFMGYLNFDPESETFPLLSLALDQNIAFWKALLKEHLIVAIYCKLRRWLELSISDYKTIQYNSYGIPDLATNKERKDGYNCCHGLDYLLENSYLQLTAEKKWIKTKPQKKSITMPESLWSSSKSYKRKVENIIDIIRYNISSLPIDITQLSEYDPTDGSIPSHLREFFFYLQGRSGNVLNLAERYNKVIPTTEKELSKSFNFWEKVMNEIIENKNL